MISLLIFVGSISVCVNCIFLFSTEPCRSVHGVVMREIILGQQVPSCFKSAFWRLDVGIIMPGILRMYELTPVHILVDEAKTNGPFPGRHSFCLSAIVSTPDGPYQFVTWPREVGSCP